MTASSRATKYEALHKSLKKHFKPAPDASERSVLEQLIYACCLEDARPEQADEAFAKLQQTYFDWNEVRVTTIAELSDALHALPFAAQAGARIKFCLQALFESRYQYDLDDLKKANLGKAVAELEAWKGMTPFIVSYVSQHAFGGHSIPLSKLILDALVQCDVITPAEAEKKSVPGLERAIPKNKGIEFASLLHQFAIELHLHPKSGQAPLVMKDLGATYKVPTKVIAPPPASGKAKKKPDASGTKGGGSPIGAAGKGTAKTESAPASPAGGKKSEVKTELKKEVGSTKPAPMKQDKPTAKKMAPPAAAGKGTAKKPASGKPTTDKDSSKKSSTKAKLKGASGDEGKGKKSPGKGKASDSGSTKKGTGSGKTSGGSASMSASLTKKKPK